MVLAPLVVSAMVVAAPQLGLKPKVPRVLPVVHVKEVVVNIAVATVTDSPDPKPLTITDGVTASSGKPKLADAGKVTETFGLTVNVAVPVLTPSVTEIACEPPGRLGTLTMTAKLPTAEVVKHPVDTVMRLLVVPVPLFASVEVQLPLAVSQGTTVVPTVVVIAIADAGA